MKKTALLFLMISAWWLNACGGGPPAREVEELPPVTVQTAAVEEVEWPSVYEATGTVSARTSATLSAKVMGYVREVKVDAGDRVKAGQLLVVLDARDLDAAYRRALAARAEANSAVAEVESAIVAAKAQLDLAEATFKRMKDLHERKSITDQEFDEASAKLRMAKANHEMALSKKPQLGDKIQQAEQAVEGAAIMQSYARIEAPFDGTVTSKMVDPGDLAAPGAPLLKVEQAGAYRLEARLEESRLRFVRLGQEVEIAIDALGKTSTARISEIIPEVDAASRAFTVRINLPRSPNLRSGLFGRVRFQTEPKRATVAPLESVVTQGQVKRVYVAEGGQARGRLVTLGESRDGQVEVLSGLAAGEKVIAPVPYSLVDGSPLEVRP